ncbi:adenosine deaminase [Sporosarcina sp. P21c]|uniref:adenine deaminase C-terminal domain-containing protein n=1 Tax=unclassified Sporosarcina TaxID=2647733 RepID=UPI000C166406|nr:MULTISPECIES: adenine deaminase C-terminal domain-containing protein [unclassified Sporosarcina]PIC66358.1 adenosine deaminase [Sporosarcina sp. P16a]PIC82647.1 adenosine deaminase [Sporosarcina sp. P1]PIC89241.1 adenosine deaminase [Sporosarcina sp. P21c]PIC92310.1 adenosine deaminase [Sporosarcina sp. P25]
MWSVKEIQSQLAIINGQKAPDIVIKNATYLHSIFKKWMQGNIWIQGDRIVYVGERMPAMLEGTECVDASGKKIVPGYIEPHVHPFQLYNPETFADYASRRGTTTFISDNLILFSMLDQQTAFTFIDQLNELPFSFYWWARVDSQTVLQNEKELFNPVDIANWMERPDVLMTGELTGWPKLLQGDQNMTQSLLESKRLGKKIEGHFPGASERTLARMKLLGADGDHEAMTAEEVERRLQQGYAVTLRYSSIRPDLPNILRGIVEKELDVFDHLMMTTDGSTPSFYREGVMDQCIQIALDAGVSPIDAYQMASYNVARYYDITDLHSVIATGRFATLNFLENEHNPVPTDVLSKGKWVLRDSMSSDAFKAVDWKALPAFELPYELTDEDFTFPSSIGIQMVNDVITKVYESDLDLSSPTIATGDECYLILLDKNGKWRVNTMLKGFGDNLQGFASSYSNTGDVLLIGQDWQEMKRAFNEIKNIGGGMALAENGGIIETLPLEAAGGLSVQPMEVIIEQELAIRKALRERGYAHGDAIYTLLFLQSVHLPYIRITPVGVLQVMKNELLIPNIER